MGLKSFTYKGVDYHIQEIVKLGDFCYKIRTIENKFFLFQYNDFIFRWIIKEIEDK